MWRRKPRWSSIAPIRDHRIIGVRRIRNAEVRVQFPVVPPRLLYHWEIPCKTKGFPGKFYVMAVVVARYTKKGDPYIRVRLSDGRITGEHRFLVEQRLGRKLRRNEHVHHKDGTKRNNRSRNLEVKEASVHSRDHQKPAKVVQLNCPACGVRFTRSLRYVRSKKALGVQYLYCGRRCRTPMKGKTIPNHVHGTLSGYNYWACRCAKCRLKKSTVYFQREKGAGRQ